MQRDLLFDIQRKVIGGYINAEEFSIKDSHKEILSVTLDEALFDNYIHKAAVRACIRLKASEIPITEYTVLDFLQKHNIPNSADQENEYLHIMTEFLITPRSFKQYIKMILEHKLEQEWKSH